MSVEQPKTPVPPSTGARVGSFLGWAFLISLLIHAVALPFFGLKRPNSDKAEVEKVSVTKKIRVVVPTPPPPTPTPPPPTPPPKQTPPPVKQTNPPPQVKIKLNVTKLQSHSGPSTENKYVPPPKGSEEGNPNGTTASGPPVPPSTGIPATPAPTPVPTPAPTLKPSCATPNADAGISGSPADAEYPDIARQQGAVGTTQVRVSLDATGSVLSVGVYKSSGNQALDNAAMVAAKSTRYTPEVVNCVKTAGTYSFKVDFTGQ
jgi:protein TonB